MITQMSIKKFFNEINLSGIDYFCWKGATKIDKFIKGEADLDLYVPQADFSKFRIILRRHGFVEFSWPIKVDGVKHFYKPGDNGLLYHLHIYTRLRTGSSLAKEYELSASSSFQDITINDYGIRILKNEDLSFLHELRVMLKKSSFFGRLFYWYKREIHSVESEHLNDIRTNGSSNLRATRIVKLSFFINLKMLLNIKYRRMLGLSKTSEAGLVTSIIGPDGAGKSTITRLIFRRYHKYLTISHLSFGRPSFQWSNLPIYLIRNLISSYKNLSSFTKITSKKNVKSIKGVSFAKAIFYVCLAYERKNIIARCLYLKKRGHIVILDRCPPRKPSDFDGYHLDRYSGSSTLIKTLQKIEAKIYDAIIDIDIVFPLDVTLDQVIERNRRRDKLGKESDDEIYDRFNLFLKFIPKSREIVKLNGSDTQSEIADLVMKSIFNTIVKT